MRYPRPRPLHSTRCIAAGLAVMAAVTQGCAPVSKLLSDAATLTAKLPSPSTLLPIANTAHDRAVPAGVEATVALSSISGPPQAVWDRLARELSVSAGGSRIALLSQQGVVADYRLIGYIVASPNGNSIAVSYVWDVLDSGGAKVARTAGVQTVAAARGGDPWVSIPDSVLKTIADKAMGTIRERPRPSGSRAPKLPAVPPSTRPSPPATSPPAPDLQEAKLEAQEANCCSLPGHRAQTSL